MQCRRCHHENSPDAFFCDQCGSRFESVCAGCGEANGDDARFCRRCGRILAGVEVASRSLTARLLSSGLLMSGERKQVTVLFADLKGSMELLIDRDPEEARRILDPVLERMIAAVHRYEGTVNQVMGDGIMALFGAPLAHERITRSAPAKRPSGCRRRSATTRRHFSGRRRSRSAYGSA
jgi:class 3 adenylate cyclase